MRPPAKGARRALSLRARPAVWGRECTPANRGRYHRAGLAPGTAAGPAEDQAMRRLGVGADGIRYSAGLQETAEVLAEALPGLRARTKELVGLSAPRLRVVLTTQPPTQSAYLRPTWLLVVLVGLSAVLATIGLVVALALLCIGTPVAALAVPTAMLLPAGFVITAGRALHRRVRRPWRSTGGFTFALPRLAKPVIVLHWPPPPRPPISERLRHAQPSLHDTARYYLAHEYGHVLLHHHYRRLPPLWFNEGFAYWLAEQLVGSPVWRPESRDCAGEPDPLPGAPWREADPERQYRLMARYYWEMHTLVAGGLLPEALSAGARDIDGFRPATLTSPEGAPSAPRGS